MGVISCKGCGDDVNDKVARCPNCGADPRVGFPPCPECKKPLEANAKFCGNCGAEVAAVVEPAALATVKVRRCPSCGRIGEQDQAYCIRDGTPLVEEEVPADSLKPGQRLRVSGATLPGQSSSVQSPSAGAPGMAVAGFVCALLGLFVPFLGVLGLILSAVGWGDANRTGAPKGLAIAGVVLGVIAVVSGLLVLAALVASGATSTMSY